MKLMNHIKILHSQSLSLVLEERYDGQFCQSFRTLSESILILLILLNRRRQGEVSKVSLNIFTENQNDVPYQNIQKYGTLEYHYLLRKNKCWLFHEF